MIVKTRKNKDGQQLYQRIHVDDQGRKTFYEEGLLSQMQFQASARSGKIPKYGNSRRRTKGRILQYTSNGKRLQHETPHRIFVKSLMIQKIHGIN